MKQIANINNIYYNMQYWLDHENIQYSKYIIK